MGIEKEIKHMSFRNEYHKLMVNLVFTSNWVLEGMKPYLDMEDITHQQFNILRILRASQKPLSTLQIRERMVDKMSDTSRIVDRLLKKDLVQKQVCAHDKRLVDITISAKGLELIERLDKQTDLMDAIPGTITTKEAESMNILLDKMREKTELAK